MTSTVKHLTQSKNLDANQYVDKDTGEPLLSQMKDCELEIVQPTDMMTIHSDNYTIIDSTAMAFLKKHLNRSEIGSLGIMSEDLKTPLNIVYNNNVPHTNESLQHILGIASSSTFNLLIKKLMKLGVLYQIKGNIMGKVRVIYMMNPFVARKRRQLDRNLLNVFKDFNEINDLKYGKKLIRSNSPSTENL
jgi:predicted transcriptional regulator